MQPGFYGRKNAAISNGEINLTFIILNQISHRKSRHHHTSSADIPTSPTIKTVILVTHDTVIMARRAVIITKTVIGITNVTRTTTAPRPSPYSGSRYLSVPDEGTDLIGYVN